MKTKFSIALLILSLVLFSFHSTVIAGSPPGNWASGIACQNLDENNAASISILFYQEGNATPVLSYPDTIPAGGSKGYFTPSSFPSLSTGFLGSAVVASTTPVACNVNTTSNGAGTATSPYRIGTSGSFSDNQMAPTMYAPQVEKNFSGWNSYLAIQNTGQSPVTVNIYYKNRFGVDITAANESYQVLAQSAKIVYQGDNANLPDNFLGSAKIQAADNTTNLAVVVNFYNSGVNSSSSQFHSYNALGSGANKLFVPYIVRNYYGYNGGLSIQNVGTSSTTVSITFRFGANSYPYTSPTIAAGSSLLLYTPNITELNGVDGLPLTQHFGSAEVQAAPGGEIVAIVNQSNFGGAGVPAERVGQGATYNAIGDGEQTNNVFLPQVPRRAGAIFSGGFQISNTTNIPTTCTITYAGYPAATETNVQLTGNGYFTRYAPGVANLPDGFNGAVTVNCGQAIVAIVNLAADPGTGKVGDSFTQSNALNR